MAYIQELLTIE